MEFSTAKKEDKDDAITRKLNVIGKYMAQYYTSVQLYSVATTLEVQLRGVDDPAEIKTYHKQIESRIVDYRTVLAECNAKITQYLNENHVLNDRPFWQNVAAVASAGAGIVLGGIAGLLPGARLAKKVDELFVDQRKQLKAERVGMAEEMIEPFPDEARLNAPLQVLKTLEKVKSRSVEILRIGDEHFTNLPDNTATA